MSRAFPSCLSGSATIGGFARISAARLDKLANASGPPLNNKMEQNNNECSLFALWKDATGFAPELEEPEVASSLTSLANWSPEVGLENCILPFSPPSEWKSISPYRQTGKSRLELNRRSGPPFLATKRQVSPTTFVSDGMPSSSINRVGLLEI